MYFVRRYQKAIIVFCASSPPTCSLTVCYNINLIWEPERFVWNTRRCLIALLFWDSLCDVKQHLPSLLRGTGDTLMLLEIIKIENHVLGDEKDDWKSVEHVHEFATSQYMFYIEYFYGHNVPRRRRCTGAQCTAYTTKKLSRVQQSLSLPLIL